MNIIKHRLILPIQKRGNLGKSTVIACLGQYLDNLNVPWKGYDLDCDHQSFSRLFPDSVSLRELGEEPVAEIIRVARNATTTPITLIDPRAHISDYVLDAFEMVNFQHYFSEQGGRITVLLFPADDVEVLTDIDCVVSKLGDSVDYIIVHNPAKQPKLRMFMGSAMESDLKSLGAKLVEIPILLAMARNHLATLEVELRRGISHIEAAANRELALDLMVRLVIENWIRTVFTRFDAVGDLIFPKDIAIKIVPVADESSRVGSKVARGAKINKGNL